jgi:hypothetical protein
LETAVAENLRSPVRRRFPWGRSAAALVGAATVLGALFTTLAYCAPRDPGSAAGTGDRDRIERPTPTPVPHLPEPMTSPSVTHLKDLTLVAGAARLAPVPPELRDQPGSDQAVVITCPSNQTHDRMSEVTYELRRRFDTLTAIMDGHHDAEDAVLVELQVFADPEDREPGSTAAAPHQVQLRTGQSRELSVDVSGAYFLRLRLLCEVTGGSLVLRGAAVSH